MLVVATLVSFLIFFMSQVHMIVAGVLIVMYLFYLWMSSTAEVEEPELVGVAATLGVMPNRQRRTAVALLFIYSAAVILVAAEPFVEALVETGGELGVEEFVLIQWLAPLASESPEIIIAVLFGLRANPVAGLSTLISAEVNQLTLLIGSMVVVFSISAGQPPELPPGLPAVGGVPPDLDGVRAGHRDGLPPAGKLAVRRGAARPVRRPPLLPGRGGAAHLLLHLPGPGRGPSGLEPAPDSRDLQRRGAVRPLAPAHDGPAGAGCTMGA